MARRVMIYESFRTDQPESEQPRSRKFNGTEILTEEEGGRGRNSFVFPFKIESRRINFVRETVKSTRLVKYLFSSVIAYRAPAAFNS